MRVLSFVAMKDELTVSFSITSGGGYEPPDGRLAKSHRSQQLFPNVSTILHLLVHGTDVPCFDLMVNGQLTPCRP